MGRDKLEMRYDGKSLLEAAVNRFSEEFQNVCISVADAAKYPSITVDRIVDILPGAGPMSGLHAALTYINCGGVFLVAADLPFSSPKAAKCMIELCGDKEACVIRLPDGKLEPLFGFYSKSLLPLCEEVIKSGDNRMTGVISGADTRFVSPSELGELWDDNMIVNVNSPEDYDKLFFTDSHLDNRKNQLLRQMKND